jgi:hypothetical protein
MSQQPGQKPRLKRPVEQVRAELLADPDTKRIARAVGMELAEYVELVLDYAQNPDKQPVLQIADDAELRANGYEPPSNEEIANFFIAGAKGELDLGGPDFNKSGFESAPSKPAVSLDGNGKGGPSRS